MILRFPIGVGLSSYFVAIEQTKITWGSRDRAQRPTRDVHAVKTLEPPWLHAVIVLTVVKSCPMPAFLDGFSLEASTRDTAHSAGSRRNARDARSWKQLWWPVGSPRKQDGYQAIHAGTWTMERFLCLGAVVFRLQTSHISATNKRWPDISSPIYHTPTCLFPKHHAR